MGSALHRDDARSTTGSLIPDPGYLCPDLEAGQATRSARIFRIGGQRDRWFRPTPSRFVGRETKPLAAKADAVIICVGFDPRRKGGFDVLPASGGQDELIRQISSVNKKRSCTDAGVT